MTVRKRLHLILQPAQQGDRTSRAFDLFILSLIAMNVLAIILESVRELREAWGAAFYIFEVSSIMVFTAEYLLRLWTCVEDPRYSHPVLGRLRAALSPLLLIDLLAILPFSLPFVTVDLRFLRSLRLFRVFRVAKVARYPTALQPRTYSRNMPRRPLRHQRHSVHTAGFLPLTFGKHLAASVRVISSSSVQIRRSASVACRRGWCDPFVLLAAFSMTASVSQDFSKSRGQNRLRAFCALFEALGQDDALDWLVENGLPGLLRRSDYFDGVGSTAK